MNGWAVRIPCECNLCDCIRDIHAIVWILLLRSLRLSEWYAQLGPVQQPVADAVWGEFNCTIGQAPCADTIRLVRHTARGRYLP